MKIFIILDYDTLYYTESLRKRGETTLQILWKATVMRTYERQIRDDKKVVNEDKETD